MNINDTIEYIKNNSSKPHTIVITGKSASGKTVVANYLSDNFKYDKLVTCTSRPPRDGEVNGVDYHFFKNDEFVNMIMSGEMIEYTTYRGWFYGIRKSDINYDIPLIIVTDIVGVRNLRDAGVDAVYVMIDRKSKDRYISSLERGDNILEIALRAERDRACYQDSVKYVDYAVENNDTVESLGTKILECVVRKYGNK